jgi:hypothetical protein
MITMTFYFFLCENQSGPKTSSIANHKFYKAKGRLHGHCCKQPLNTINGVDEIMAYDLL